MKSTGSVPLILSFSLYIGLAIAFAVGASEFYLYILGAVALATSVWLMSASLVKALYLVILVTHIGPILKGTIPGIGAFTLGDTYLLLLLIFFLSKAALKGIRRPPFALASFTLAILAVVSVVLSPDVVAALPGLLNMGQVTLVYLLVLNEVRTREDAAKIIQGIGIAVLVSALLHLVFYARGLSLALSGQNEWQQNVLLADLASADYQRTAFFYVSFHASSAVAIILGIRQLLLPNRTHLGTRLFWLAVVTLAVSSSLVSGSKTTILAAALVSIPALFASIKKSSMRTKLQSFVLFPLVIIVPVLIFGNIVRSGQQELLQETIVLDSVISISERFLMWSEISDKILSSPKTIIFGVGPDVPERAPDDPEIHRLMYIPSLQFQPPSFHNFYVDVLFQEGVFFLVLMLGIIFSTLRKLRAHVKAGDGLAGNCFFAILGWLLVWVSHATGWSKPVLILSVLLALAHLVVFDKLKTTQ